EKYTYLASVGYVLILAWLIHQLYRGLQKKKYKNWLIVGVGILTCWYGYLTLVRNADWKNDVVLWEKTVEQSAENPLAHYKLGSAYRDSGDLTKAKASYLTSLKMYPKLTEALNNLGVIAEKEKDYENAEEYYLRAIEIRPTMPELHNNLGVVYLRQERYREAIEEFTLALQYDRNYLQAKINLVEAQKRLKTFQIEGG
ncbi:MAG: tetratricopeptide repeat protein, partial [Candidatus Heimdallarchaeota archaeon]|nr:tetratricopeptide repeat protein [Candidatus Heimdallarchaeota archaeon]